MCQVRQIKCQLLQSYKGWFTMYCDTGLLLALHCIILGEVELCCSDLSFLDHMQGYYISYTGIETVLSIPILASHVALLQLV